MIRQPDPPAARVLVPRGTVRSRAGSALLWVALVWAIAFAFAADALLGAVGVPRGPRPWPLAVLLAILGFGPLVVWLFAGRLGRLQPFGWLVEHDEARLILDTDGITIEHGSSQTARIPWSDIAEFRIVHPTKPTRVIGRDGTVLAEIPANLVTPKIEGNGETRLFDEIATFQPRLAGSSEQVLQGAVIVAVIVLLAVLAVVGVVLLTR